jgi:hypothetical protein
MALSLRSSFLKLGAKASYGLQNSTSPGPVQNLPFSSSSKIFSQKFSQILSMTEKSAKSD